MYNICVYKIRGDQYHKHPLRISIKEAKRRCENRNRKDYKYYGGKGIEFRLGNVRQAFDRLLPMYEHAQHKYPNEALCIDRINNSGHYEYKNIQFITHTENNRKDKGKKVLCLETGEIYKSATQASDDNDLHRTSVGKACRGERKTSGGFRWKYI